ncbi:AAA family ATPase [Actinoplanes sp. NPDC024001]|uniref:NACHT domain-containing protein n=1 Tax=Actinoplanes sp. NPDC024001 TaxID=3154598 RepID=UPI0033FEE4EA
MPQGLTYHDAVKLLGGSGPLVRIADNLLGGALSLATAGGSDAALSLFDAKAEAIRLGHQVSSRITEIVRGQGRYHRSERLLAAHGVLVVTAFFEALDTRLGAAGLESAGFDRDEQSRLLVAGATASDWTSRLLLAALPSPAPDLSYDALLRELGQWWRAAAHRVADHLGHLAAWENTVRLGEALAADVPGLAAARYEENLRRLAEEVPEFAIWLRQLDSRAATRGLEALEQTLLRVTSHRDPARHRAALARTYRAALGQPILGGDAGDLVMPALGTAYLDPRYRVKPAEPGARPADESWWDTAPRTDLAAFLAMYLTTPQASEVPLLLLGQPGAGKSSLTRVLAARLPAADFLVVRVALREVRAEAEIQDQIEQALRATIGETVAWPDLARDADAAMPVVLLDGFDELLQATGIHQSDYLQRVAAFQQREALLGRPVAVMVTSRIAVADRARVPAGSLVVRLEPFDAAQQEQWLAIWAGANAAHWAGAGRRPLGPGVLRRFRDLAEQPLLLLMLALYDATGNALQEAGETFGSAQLYERLLREFAAREVHRVHGEQPDSAVPALVEHELLRLSVVAFAMFHRGRLWVTTGELDTDLAGLGLRPTRPQPTQAFRTPISAGQEMVGRFFFIQRAQALQDDQTLQTYEFLHATFGEYLVARLVVQAVTDAAARARARTLHLGPAEDDDLLQSLLGYTPLSARTTVIPFIAELLPGADRSGAREWIVERLRVAVTRPSYTPRAYQPVDKRVDHWMATYSFNLTMLALACGPPLHASELYLYAKDPAGWLRDMALQWRAAVPGGMFLDALEHVEVTRCWAGDGRRDMRLEHSDAMVSSTVDPLWSHSFGPSWRYGETATIGGVSRYFPIYTALQSMHLSGAFSDDALRHALDPLLSWAPELMINFVGHGPREYESVAHSLISLWLASAQRAEPSALYHAYERALSSAVATGSADVIRLVLHSLVHDVPRLDGPTTLNLLSMVSAPAVPLVECLLAVAPDGLSAQDAQFRRTRLQTMVNSLRDRPDLIERLRAELAAA